MSGAPNPVQVEQLKQSVDKYRDALKSLEDAQRWLKYYNREAETAHEAARVSFEKAVKLLEAMDCGPNGNYGSGLRVVTLLHMLTAPPAEAAPEAVAP